jgi:uncharacterized protein (TIGR02246 family)
MKKTAITALAVFALSMGFSSTTNAQKQNTKAVSVKSTSEKADVEKLVKDYFAALNSSDASKVVSLFTADGVLLAPGAPTATGSEQVKGTFQYVFDNFKYSLNVTIGEVVVDKDYAFVASTSKGSFVIKSSNQTVEDDFRETFVLKKVNGQWKIARYMYNKSK